MKHYKVHCDRWLRSLRPILNNWIRVNKRYVRRFLRSPHHDRIWWHNERANVGSLAAAAWLAGGTALEEYGTTKIQGRPGRCDVRLMIGRRDFACEAKLVWCNTESKHGLENVRKKLKRAWRAAGMLKRNEAPDRLAACFVVPYYKKKDPPQLDALIKDIRELYSYDSYAWCFPPSARNLKYEGKYYPGVLLLIWSRQRSL